MTEMTDLNNPITPGEILLEEYLEQMEMFAEEVMLAFKGRAVEPVPTD